MDSKLINLHPIDAEEAGSDEHDGLSRLAQR